MVKRVGLMLLRIILLLTGFTLAVSGGVSTIAYLNLLTMGHDFMEYITYISKRIECYLLAIGILIIWFSIYFPNNYTNK
jgi:hypothetical protein